MESLDVILYGLCVAIALALFLFSAFRLYQACTPPPAQSFSRKPPSRSPSSRGRLAQPEGAVHAHMRHAQHDHHPAVLPNAVLRSSSATAGSTFEQQCTSSSADTVALIAVFAAYAKNTASGGYTSDGPGAFQVKITNYLLDMAVGVTILAGAVFRAGKAPGEQQDAAERREGCKFGGDDLVVPNRHQVGLHNVCGGVRCRDLQGGHKHGPHQPDRRSADGQQRLSAPYSCNQNHHHGHEFVSTVRFGQDYVQCGCFKTHAKRFIECLLFVAICRHLPPFAACEMEPSNIPPRFRTM
ncbi:hypothetical protein DFJ73DRAFT_905190 [Zopfochytrium polystomum]|nr:hypothetical protein DFJ73DRAFT_905190 [Zopfochytrium polystomum]